MAKTAPATLGCTIRTLPPELAIEAARVAVDIFPANRPAVQQFASMIPGDGGDVLVPQFIAALTTKYFGPQPRVLPVSFHGADVAPTVRNKIIEYLNRWDCGLTYAWTAGVGKVRIGFERSGFWSYLGTDILMIPEDRPTMNLQGFDSLGYWPESEWRRIVPHEGGHTAGLVHEHLRRAEVERLYRERVIARMKREQGWSEAQVISQALTPVEESSLIPGPVEDDSIMCYRFEPEDTIDGRGIAGGSDITANDRKFMLAIYPKAAGPVAPPSPPPVRPPEPKPPVEPETIRPPSRPKTLNVGYTSRKLALKPGEEHWFKVRISRAGGYAVATRGDVSLSLSLYRLVAGGLVAQAGSPARIDAALNPGLYYVRVRGVSPADTGNFQVKVATR